MIPSGLSHVSTCASSSEIINNVFTNQQEYWQDLATELIREVSGDSLSTINIFDSFWPADASLEHTGVIVFTRETDWSQLPDIPPALDIPLCDPEFLEADALGVWAQDVLGAPDSADHNDVVTNECHFHGRN